MEVVEKHVQDREGLVTGTSALVGTLAVGEQDVTVPPNQADSDPNDIGDYAAHACPGRGNTCPIIQMVPTRKKESTK